MTTAGIFHFLGHLACTRGQWKTGKNNRKFYYSYNDGHFLPFSLSMRATKQLETLDQYWFAGILGSFSSSIRATKAWKTIKNSTTMTITCNCTHLGLSCVHFKIDFAHGGTKTWRKKPWLVILCEHFYTFKSFMRETIFSKTIKSSTSEIVWVYFLPFSWNNYSTICVGIYFCFNKNSTAPSPEEKS